MQTIAPDASIYRSLSHAARRFPPSKTDRPVHTATLTRWIVKGVRSASGAIVKLEARRFPGGWKVTDQAVEEFLDKLTAAALDHPQAGGAETVRTSTQRQRENECVDRACAAAGI
jgi:hypothetical protein